MRLWNISNSVCLGTSFKMTDEIQRHLGGGGVQWLITNQIHNSDVIINVMAYLITGVSIVYSTVCSVDQIKHQSWPVTGEFPSQRASNTEMFPYDDVIMLRPILTCHYVIYITLTS